MKLLAITLLSLFFIHSETLTAQGFATFGSSEEDKSYSIDFSNNNFYIAGTTRKDNRSAADYFVLKIGLNGYKNQEFVFGDFHRDIGKDILVNENGIFVLGKTWDGGFPNNDMVLTRLGFDGKIKWKKYYGGTHNDLGHKMAETKGGGFIMAGFNRSVDDFGNAYLVKADANGELEWEKDFGGIYVDHGFDVLENANNEIIMAGTLGGFYNPTSTDFLNRDADIFVIKTDGNGNEIWSKTYGGESHDWAKSIIESPEGGYFICGSSQSEGAGSFDLFLMKIDEDGNQIWMKTYGGDDWEYGESVQWSTDQHLYLLGTSASFSGNYKPDHFLVKTNLNGDIIWSETFGGPYSDYSSGLVATPDSGCVFTGWTDNGTHGKQDVVFYKIAKDGTAESISGLRPLNDSIEQITVFPNPANTKFSVLIDTRLKTDFQMRLYNLQGELMYEDTIQPNIAIPQFAELPSGTYVVSILNNDNVIYNTKLIFH